MPLKFAHTKQIIAHERLLALLSYDPDTGHLTWKVPRRKVRVGSRAGSVKVNRDGSKSRQINIDGHVYNEHRVVWFYVHGVWPEGELDHRDLDGTNNRFVNLRPATRHDNLMNTGVRKDSALGVKGVRRTKAGRFSASIKVDGSQRHLGTFDTMDAAHAAFKSAIEARNPEFARAA